MDSLFFYHMKPIKDFPAYGVSSDGKVFRLKSDGTKKEVKQYDNGLGYKQVKLYKNGQRYTKNVHRLVAGEPNTDVDHIDDNKSNNSSGNLQPISHSENVKKAMNK